VAGSHRRNYQYACCDLRCKFIEGQLRLVSEYSYVEGYIDRSCSHKAILFYELFCVKNAVSIYARLSTVMSIART
jgi:hypothetical protein